MTTFLAFGLTLFLTIIGFGLVFGALVFAKPKKRQCACQAAKSLMREFERREATARQAQRYHPQRVDAQHLPIVDDR